MIQLFFFLLIGAALLSSLLFLSRHGGSRVEGDSVVLLEARKALDALQGGLLPEELVQRIFAKDDLDYLISMPASKSVRDLFVVEPKRIALFMDQPGSAPNLESETFPCGCRAILHTAWPAHRVSACLPLRSLARGLSRFAPGGICGWPLCGSSHGRHHSNRSGQDLRDFRAVTWLFEPRAAEAICP